MAGVKTKDIAEKYHLDQDKFDAFVWANRANYRVNEGLFSVTVADADVAKVVEAYRNYMQGNFERSKAEAEQKKKQEQEERASQVAAANERIRAQRQAEEEKVKRRQAAANMLVIPGSHFEGYRITKYGAFLSSESSTEVERGQGNMNSTARENALNTKSRIESGLNTIRTQAFDALKEKAAAQGYNAIIGISYDYVTVEPVTTGIMNGNLPLYLPYVLTCTANGTAVCIEKTENE